MEGIILALGILLVITYLWIMSLFKKRDATLEALDTIDSYVLAQINLLLKWQGSAILLMEEEVKAALADIANDLKVDYDKLNWKSVERHFADMLHFEQLTQSALKEMVQNSPLVQETELLRGVQTYQDLAESIKDAYQYYNVVVSEFNTAVNAFPGVIIAYLLRVKSLPLYPIKLCP
ncbi:LemA family protein [uncultured Shewanella sp.]|uniref:LemA family protein n=1 Tax=uncultured Shewanella sp. TaxID=173975 RepID=UPI002637E03B|nr:LemA family protein [uncultured Shewanella sp.]